MKIVIACPAPPGSGAGNRVTAERWRRHLIAAGHQVVIAPANGGPKADVLLALHARKSYPAVARFLRENPGAPLIVALTGTDLYRDLPMSRRAQFSVHNASRLIGLHDAVGEALPDDAARAKLRVILQSTQPIAPRPRQSATTFDVCVLGHLRYEKDPLRAALALRQLPNLETMRLVQAGGALTARYAQWAKAAMRRDARFRWLGEISRVAALRLLASSRLMVISSHMEGGANVVSEAIVNRVPILASYIAGNIGLLGRDYLGYFPTGDTRALAELLNRVIHDRQFYEKLQSAIGERAPRFEPRREQAALARLIAELIYDRA